MTYALTTSAAPLFNTPDMKSAFGGRDGDSIDLDDTGLFRAVETILPAEAKVKLIEKRSSLWKVETVEYPFPGDFFIDPYFLAVQKREPPERGRSLPSIEKILASYPALLGSRYIWGGNNPDGIPALKELYPPRSSFKTLPQSTQEVWTLQGVDCSGLLHYLTSGFTPHRTSALLHFGQELSIEGKKEEEILALLQPLDLIVWPGHVVIVVDQQRVLESVHPEGVILTELHIRLSEIIKTKNSIFKIRRFY